MRIAIKKRKMERKEKEKELLLILNEEPQAIKRRKMEGKEKGEELLLILNEEPQFLPENTPAAAASATATTTATATAQNNYDLPDTPPARTAALPILYDKPAVHGPINVGVINAQSCIPKIDDLINQFQARDLSILLVSETWNNQRLDIEAFQETHSVTWIGKSRTGSGGGVAAVVTDFHFVTKQYKKVKVPPQLEIAWSVASPKWDPSLKILIGAFYVSTNPDYRPPTDMLQNHCMEVIDIFKGDHVNGRVIVGGDYNYDRIGDLIILPGFGSHQKLPTRKPSLRGDGVLDLIISDLDVIDGSNAVFPGLAADAGNTSDHKIATVSFLPPLPNKKTWTIMKKRYYSNGAAEKFKSSFLKFNWDILTSFVGVDEMVDAFHNRVDMLLEEFFPLRTSRVRVQEPAYFDESLKSLHRKMKKLYKKGNTLKFRAAKKKFEFNLKKKRSGYFNLKLDSSRKKDTKMYHADIKDLMRTGGLRERQCAPNLVDMVGLSNKECANKAAESIAKLTADHPPVDMTAEMNKCCVQQPEVLLEEEVRVAFKELRLPKGLHPDDPPRQLLIDMYDIFVPPLTTIINKIFTNGAWPKRWKTEMTTFIPKNKQPEVIRDLRPITGSFTWAKLAEKLIRARILADIQPEVVRQGVPMTFSDQQAPRQHQQPPPLRTPCDDLCLEQYGGAKNVSADMMMANIYQDLLDRTEAGFPSLLLAWDLSKAFNTIGILGCLESCHRLGIRPQMVKILASYLCGRSTVVRWEQERSDSYPSRGGSGQGTLLSVLLFVITVDRLISDLKQSISGLEQHLPEVAKTRVFVYVDDINVTTSIAPESIVEVAGVKKYIGDGRISAYFKVISDFSESSKLKLNTDKTKIIPFDYSKNAVTFPEDSFSYPDGEAIEVAQEMKLLGNIVSANLSMDGLVDQRRKAGVYALWQLRRLHNQGISVEHKLAVYKAYIRSRVEYGLLSACPMLKETHWHEIGRVERKASRLILGVTGYGEGVPTYQQRLKTLGLEPIRERTRRRFAEFALKVEKEPRFGRYFSFHSDSAIPRRKSRHYDIPFSRTYRRSNGPLMTILNDLNAREDSPESRTVTVPDPPKECESELRQFVEDF